MTFSFRSNRSGLGTDELRFWTEQYLLQAFLTFNSEFEVLIANNYLNYYHQQDLEAVFPHLESWGGGSFWMRRTGESRTPLEAEKLAVKWRNRQTGQFLW